MTQNRKPEADVTTLAPGDSIDGRWTVDVLLGEGTFGRVFRVTDAAGQLYALKMLKLTEIPPHDRINLLRRFDREYETGLIESPYLVRSRAKGVVNGNAYFVMDYCPGGDLRQAIKTGNIDLPLIARHIMLGLKELHTNGKVHRDLKPDNVLLLSNTHAVLTDFGISGDQNNRLTVRGTNGIPEQRFGTLAYMPPEQLNPRRDNATVLPTTDIYSFGVMLYRLLTDTLPFGELNSATDLVNYTANCSRGKWDRRRLLSIPRGYEWLPVLEGCLAPDFQRRLADADAVIALLPKPSTVTPPTLSDSPDTPRFNTDITHGIQLRVTHGEQQGELFNLPKLFTNRVKIITIGRRGEIWNHIQLCETESNYISRRHCTIEYNAAAKQWILRDGQFRSKCTLGLSLPAIFPCPVCKAYCTRQDRTLEWVDSMNGTFVNSHRVGREGYLLNAGDIISLGDIKLRVEGL